MGNWVEAKSSRCFFPQCLCFFPPFIRWKNCSEWRRSMSYGVGANGNVSHRDFRVKCYGLNVEEHTGLNGGLLYCVSVSLFSTAKKGVCQKEWFSVSTVPFRNKTLRFYWKRLVSFESDKYHMPFTVWLDILCLWFIRLRNIIRH